MESLRKTKKPPPLVIVNTTSSLVKALMLTNAIKLFSTRQNLITVKLSTETKEEHTRAINVLDSQNVEFYTFKNKGEYADTSHTASMPNTEPNALKHRLNKKKRRCIGFNSHHNFFYCIWQLYIFHQTTRVVSLSTVLYLPNGINFF